MKIKYHFTRKKELLFLVLKIFSLFIIAFFALATASIQWARIKWGELSIYEIIYHLTAPLEGTSNDMLIEFSVKCILPTILVLLVILAVRKALKDKKKYLLIAEAVISIIMAVSFGAVGARAWTEWGVSDYMNNSNTYSNFIDDNYVNPKNVEISFPEKKRNLIYIYMESMEVTYADDSSGGAFEDNYIPALTELAQKAENFSGEMGILNGAYALSNTTWTMGAMYGQSVGLPLTLSIDGSQMDSQDTFFPEIVSIGDILEDFGYQNALLIGSKAAFGGRELFYSEHGNYKIWDYTYAKETGEIPQNYYVWWGYEDKKLFENAQKRLQELSAQEEPFNLTILTADTHFEDGYYCEECPDTYGDNQYANVITCSDKRVSEFIDWVQEQDFYENTTIVLVGDHPTMDADFCDSVDEKYVRKVYTAYLNAPLETIRTDYRDYSTFDLFPTTLAAIGAEIEGERLGLGTNLYSDVETLTEKYGREEEDAEILKKSRMIDRLNASIDENTDKVSEQEKMLKANMVDTEISIHSYDFQKESYEIEISVTDPDDSIRKVTCAVWKNEDQSDLKWYEAEYADDCYTFTLHAADCDYISGVYQLDVYGFDENENDYYLACVEKELDFDD